MTSTNYAKQANHAARKAAKALTRKQSGRRTGQFVRNSSYHAGERERSRWRETNMFDRSENNARMRLAEQYEHDTKQPGRKNGALGHIGLEVLRLLLRLRGRRDGRLDPSYSWMAWELRRSRAAVVAAVQRLKRHRFLEAQRRTRPVANPEPGGQYVEQISNAYFLTVPGEIAAGIRRIMMRVREGWRRSTTLSERQARAERAARSQPPAPPMAGPERPRSILDALADLEAGVARADAKRASQ